MAAKPAQATLLHNRQNGCQVVIESEGAQHHQILTQVANECQRRKPQIDWRVVKTGNTQSKRTALMKSSGGYIFDSQMILPAKNSNKYVVTGAAGLALRVGIVNITRAPAKQSDTYWFNRTFYNRDQMHVERCAELLIRFITGLGAV